MITSQKRIITFFNSSFVDYDKKVVKMKKCVICGKEIESNYEYCPNCGVSTQELKVRKLPLPKLIAFNVIGGLILFLAMGIIGIFIVIIIDLIIWYSSPKI